MTWGDLPWGSVAWGDPDATITFPAAGASENVCIFDGLSSDSATLMTDQTAAVTVAALQDRHPSYKWRSSAVADQISITSAIPIAWNGLAMNAHNVDVWRLRGFASAADRTAGTSAVIDTNYCSPWPLNVRPADEDWLNYVSILRWTNEQPLQHWLLDVATYDSTAVEAGRLMVCRYFQPARNMEFESSIAYEPADIQVESEYGAVDTEARFSPRVFDLQFADMEWSDAQERASELHRRLGRARDLIAVLDPGATGGDFHRQTIHGVLTAGGKYEPQKGWADGRMVWRTQLRIKELLF